MVRSVRFAAADCLRSDALLVDPQKLERDFVEPFGRKCFFAMGLRPMVTKIILGYIAASAGT